MKEQKKIVKRLCHPQKALSEYLAGRSTMLPVSSIDKRLWFVRELGLDEISRVVHLRSKRRNSRIVRVDYDREKALYIFKSMLHHSEIHFTVKDDRLLSVFLFSGLCWLRFEPSGSAKVAIKTYLKIKQLNFIV